MTGTYYQNITDSGPACVACIPGTYSNISGATSNVTCTTCPGGSYSSLIGASSLTQCHLCVAGNLIMIYLLAVSHKPRDIGDI